MNQLEHCIDAAHLVGLAVEKKLTGLFGINEQKMMRSSVALMLYLLGKIENFLISQDRSIAMQAGQMKTCGLHKICQGLSKWLQHGRHKLVDNYSVILACSKVELKVHTSDTYTHA